MSQQAHTTTPQKENANTDGRTRLRAWREAQLSSFFTTDPFLQSCLKSYLPTDDEPTSLPLLEKAGREMAALDPLVQQLEDRMSLPRLERYSSIGERTEDILFHPTYEAVGDAIYGTRLMSVYEKPAQHRLALSLFYLTSQHGEAGHNCPVACTAGVIKILQNLAPPALAERFLPKLFDPSFRTNYTGAQFLTEIQGGSDVGANATMATPNPKDPTRWRINGEKWFCSNADADLILMTARVPDQGDGTKGLGLFLVPRLREDGSLNGIYLRRLKEKLGTRALASAECDFVDAEAYVMGEPHEGFHHVMRHVINTSRLYNAIGVTGNARRAFTTAWLYTQHRAAFGQPIHRFPLVQDLLARMKTDIWAILSASLQLCHLYDQQELGQNSQDDQALMRMALNLNKYRSAVLAHDVILQAIEILGGNGAIESFSCLPRLLRDNVVYENWEGTHNVLIAQVQRDMLRFQLHQPFFAWIDAQFSRLPHDHPLAQSAPAASRHLQEQTASLLQRDPHEASLFFRPLLERATDLYYTACLTTPLLDAQRRQDPLAPLIQEAQRLFFARRVERQEALAIPRYSEAIRNLAADI